MAAGPFVAVFVVLLASGGCSQPIPGDGRLVLVTVDTTIASLMVQVVHEDGTLATTTLGTFVTRGMRYWDAVGARLRTADEVAPDEMIAAELHIATASALDHSLDRAPAFYSELDGAVYVDPEQLRARGDSYYSEVEFAALFAHEAGHALGLQHEPLCAGIMAQRCWLPRLTNVDITQFVRVVH